MTKKLTVNILLFNTGLGGGDRVTSIYAKHLLDKGHNVHVTALMGPLPPFLHRVKHFLKTGKILKRSFTTAHFDNAGVRVNVVSGKSALEDSDIPDGDILLATFWITAEWAMKMSPSKGVKAYFVQNYESTFPGAPPKQVDATYTASIRKIVISNWLETLMREKFEQEPVANIANGVDLNQFHASPRNKNDVPCVGFLYGDSPIKGVDVTLKAIQQLQQNIPDLKVVAFGSSPVGKSLPLPPGCTFHFKPAQDNIRNLYAQCDVWLSGSRVEGFNLPPLEAMACRTPVVATSAGAMPEVIENGVQGFVVPVEDSDALAEKALSVLRLDNSAWRRMSDAAYESATRYTWEDAADKFEAALHKIMAEKAT